DPLGVEGDDLVGLGGFIGVGDDGVGGGEADDQRPGFGAVVVGGDAEEVLDIVGADALVDVGGAGREDGPGEVDAAHAAKGGGGGWGGVGVVDRIAIVGGVGAWVSVGLFVGSGGLSIANCGLAIGIGGSVGLFGNARLSMVDCGLAIGNAVSVGLIGDGAWGA